MTHEIQTRRFTTGLREEYERRAAKAVGLPESGTHVLALDGLRGLAIMLVMFVHFTIYSGMQPAVGADFVFFRIASAGWAGVDLFFVLSGFLITGILHDTRESAGYFRNFYARRVLRIFPLYYGFLIFALMLLPTLLRAAEAAALRADAPWYWLYGSNLLVAMRGWPATDLPNFTLGHFWSLAVEEQFYLFWPPLVFLVRGPNLRRLCVAVIVAALAIRAAVALSGNTAGAYVLTPARMDALAVGAWVALTIRTEDGLARLRRYAPFAVMIAALVLATMFVSLNGLDAERPLVQIVGFPLLNCLFAAMLALALPGGHTSRYQVWLEHPIMRFLGRYSYGIYVFHQPLVLLLRRIGLSADSFPVVLRSQLPGQIVFMLTCAIASMSIAYVVWHVYEVRFLRLKCYFEYRTTG